METMASYRLRSRHGLLAYLAHKQLDSVVVLEAGVCLTETGKLLELLANNRGGFGGREVGAGH